MKLIKSIYLVPLMLATGCSFYEPYDYDDYSVYQYDVENHYGLSMYESYDYQDDYYGVDDGVFKHNMRMNRDYWD